MSLPPLRNVRRLLIFWLFLLGAVSYLDRVNISIASPSIAREFDFNNIQLGWIFSAFLLGYGLLQPFAGKLADRFGARLVLTLSAVWWAAFTVAVTFPPSSSSHALAGFLAARFLLGAGEAAMYPASNAVVSHWIPRAERGLANGFIFAGVGLGAAVTSPLITALMLRYGWRTSFYVSAALGLLAGFCWFFLARDQPSRHPWITAAELKKIESVPPETPEDPLPAPELITLLRSFDLPALTLSYFAFGYVAQMFFSWFFLYLVQVRQLDLRRSALYTILPFIAMAAGSVLGGLISDRLMRKQGERFGRASIAFFGLACCAVFLLLGNAARSAGLASVVLAGGAGVLYLAQSSFWSASASLGGSSAGVVSGFMNSGGQLGGAVTASLTPALAEHFGWKTSFAVASAIAVLGALAWLRIGSKRPQSA